MRWRAIVKHIASNSPLEKKPLGKYTTITENILLRFIQGNQRTSLEDAQFGRIKRTVEEGEVADQPYFGASDSQVAERSLSETVDALKGSSHSPLFFTSRGRFPLFFVLSLNSLRVRGIASVYGGSP